MTLKAGIKYSGRSLKAVRVITSLIVFSLILFLFCEINLLANEMESPKNHFFFDVGYLTPIGVEMGIGGAPINYFDAFVTFGLMAFDTGTDLDDTYSGLLKMSRFYTWSFGIRYRFSPCKLPGGTKNHFFIGWILRDFPASPGGGDALDCLYCSTSGKSIEMRPHQYLSIGARYGKGLLSIDYRLTNHKGSASFWGYDPYGVGSEWYLEYDNVNTPKLIARLSIYLESNF